MPDTPTPETSVSTWSGSSDIESIRKDVERAAQFAGGDEVDLVEYGWERINLAGNPPDYWYAHSMLMPCEPGEEVTLDRAMTIQAAEIMERLVSHCNSLLSALAIAREEAIEECAKIARDEHGKSSSMGYKQAAANIEDRIRSLSHTPQSTQKEKQP